MLPCRPTWLCAGQWAGLAVRAGGPGDDDMYLAVLEDTPSGIEAVIERSLNGQWRTLASGNAKSGTGTPTFEALGSHLELFLGDTLLVEATDTALTSGTVGLDAGRGASLGDFMAY